MDGCVRCCWVGRRYECSCVGGEPRREEGLAASQPICEAHSPLHIAAAAAAAAAASIVASCSDYYGEINSDTTHESDQYGNTATILSHIVLNSV